MRPDFKKYATGYGWLDWLTKPFWTLYFWWHQWRFYKFLGEGDAERGREILKRAVEVADEDSELPHSRRDIAILGGDPSL